MARFRLAVLGVGQIGSTFAYKLARAGHEVTVIARPGSSRLTQLRRDNGIVLKTGDHAEVRVADELDEQTAYDLVVVTTLAHQAESLLPALARSKAQCVHFMSVNFNPERFEQAIGDKRCTFGMVRNGFAGSRGQAQSDDRFETKDASWRSAVGESVQRCGDTIGIRAAHANAMCELYRTTRPSAAQLETLLAMAVDGTGAQAWDFDPGIHLPDFTTFSCDEASRLLSAGYIVRRLLGTHPLEGVPADVPSDVFDASPFEERARRGSRRRHSAA